MTYGRPRSSSAYATTASPHFVPSFPCAGPLPITAPAHSAEIQAIGAAFGPFRRVRCKVSHPRGEPLTWLVRLDLERVRRNMPDEAGNPLDEEVVRRFLAVIGVRGKGDGWWRASDEALLNFRDGEVLEKRAAP